MSKTPRRLLIEFICFQELDLEQYHSLIPLLQERFHVSTYKDPEAECPGDLVDTIIRWENHEFIDSLEETLRNRFRIKLKESYILEKWKGGLSVDEAGMIEITPDFTHTFYKDGK